MFSKIGIDGILAYINAFLDWAIRIAEAANSESLAGLISALKNAKNALGYEEKA